MIPSMLKRISLSTNWLWASIVVQNVVGFADAVALVLGYHAAVRLEL